MPPARRLLGDSRLRHPADDPDSVVKLLGHEVVVTSTGAEAGGPGPTASADPLALRQRLLSEAALRPRGGRHRAAGRHPAHGVARRGRRVVLHHSSRRGSTWCRRRDRRRPAPPWAARPELTYTDRPSRRARSRGLLRGQPRRRGRHAAGAGARSCRPTIEAQVRDELLVTLSEQHRERPGPAVAAAERVEDAIRTDLGQDRDRGTPRGHPLSATPARSVSRSSTASTSRSRCRCRCGPDGELTLSGGGVRRSVPVRAASSGSRPPPSRSGVHDVRLAVTSLDGVPLGLLRLAAHPRRPGERDHLDRDGRGALVLFGMIGYRLPGQIRARRAELAAASQGEDEAAGTTTIPSTPRDARRAPRRRTTRAVEPLRRCSGPTVSTA